MEETPVMVQARIDPAEKQLFAIRLAEENTRGAEVIREAVNLFIRFGRFWDKVDWEALQLEEDC